MVYTTQNNMGGLGQAIQGLGGTLGQVLEQRGQQQAQQLAVQEAAQQRAASGSVIQDAIDKAAIDPVTGERRDLSSMELISALTDAQSQGAHPEDIKSYGTLFSTLSKQGAGDKGKEEKIHKLRVGLSTLNKIEELYNKGNIGTTFGFRLDPTANIGETGEDRAQFEKLGQSLIALVSAGVSIRNIKEFEEYKSIITTPNSSKAQIKGAVAGLKQLMGIQLEEYGEEVPSISAVGDVISTPQGEVVEEQEKIELIVGQTATNPKTKQKLQWTGSTWRKI